MRTPRACVVAVIAVVLLLAAFSWSGDGARLTTSPAAASPGGNVSVVGTGLVLPSVTTCEVSWTGPALPRSGCVVKGHVIAQLPLAAAGTLPSGDYTVTVCAPTCARPWAGRADRVLTVADGEPASGSTGTGDSGTADTGAATPQPGTADNPLSSQTSPPDVATDIPAPATETAAETAAETSAPPTDTAAPGPAPSPTAGDPVPGRRAVAVGTVVEGLRLQAVSLSRAAGPGAALTPNPASRTDTVQLEAPGLPAVPAGCQLRWDGTASGSCRVDGRGEVRGTVQVPRDAPAGAHLIVACRADCTLPAVLSRPATVTVAGMTPDERRTVPAGVAVPRLIGLTPTAARLVLAPLGLRLDPTARGTGLITRQDPVAGATVTAGARVTVAVGTAPAAASGSVVPQRLLLGVAIAAVALLAGVVGARLRSRPGRTPGPAPAPQLLALPDSNPTVTVAARAPEQRRPGLALQARPDGNPTIRTEVRR